MEKKKLTVFENMIWNSLGSFVYLICQWLLTFIVVRCSSDMTNAGNLSLAISITNIFYNLAHFNVRPYLVSDLKNNYTSNEYSAFRIITCIFSVGVCCIYISLFGYTGQQFSCIMLYMVFKLGEAWVDLLHGFEQKKSRMDIGGISMFVRGILSILSFSIMLYYTDNINWSIMVMTICTIGFIVFFDCNQAKKFADYFPKLSLKRTSKMLMEFLPLTIGSFVSNVGVTLPKQALELKMGSESLGFYSTVATPAVIVRVAATYVFNPVLTEFARFYNAGDKKKFINIIVKVSGILLGISIICMCGAGILGEFGLVLLYGEKIRPYVYLLIPVIGYTCLNAFESFLWNLLIVMRKIRWLWIVNVIGVLICISIMNSMINTYGMAGVSYTMIIYSASLIVMMSAIVINDIRKNNIEKSI